MAEVSGYKSNIPSQQNLPVNRSGDVAQTGGVKGSQKVQRPAELTAEQVAQQVQQKIPTYARKMTLRDVAQQLLQIDVRPTAENRSLALKMVLLGMELSKANFTQIENLLKGLPRNAHTEQAAIILAGKELPSRTAVMQLAAFLENNPKLSNQLNALMEGSQNVLSMLSGQTVISSGLAGQLSALLSSMEGFITALPKDLRDKLNRKDGLFNKAELLTNMRALKALINGIDQKAAEEARPAANAFLSALRGLSGKAKEIAENIIVQSILSRPSEREDNALQEKFSYWQVPNSLSNPPQTLEILVQRDKKNKNRSIDPRKTKLVIKTETEALGELSIEVEVEDDNCDFRFNTIEEKVRQLINEEIENLKQKLQESQYKTRSVRVVKRNLDVKKFLIPTLDLDNLTRVQTEV